MGEKIKKLVWNPWTQMGRKKVTPHLPMHLYCHLATFLEMKSMICSLADGLDGG